MFKRMRIICIIKSENIHEFMFIPGLVLVPVPVPGLVSLPGNVKVTGLRKPSCKKSPLLYFGLP